MGVLLEIAKGLIGIRRNRGNGATVLILTPVKDAARFLPTYCERLLDLTYPKHLISVGLIEGDSEDETVPEIERQMPNLRRAFRRAEWWKRDFGFRIPPGMPRWAESIQLKRRVALARSRGAHIRICTATANRAVELDIIKHIAPRHEVPDLSGGRTGGSLWTPAAGPAYVATVLMLYLDLPDTPLWPSPRDHQRR